MMSDRESIHRDIALTEEEDLLGIADVNRQERERYETMDITKLAEEIERLQTSENPEKNEWRLALLEIYERRNKPMA